MPESSLPNSTERLAHARHQSRQGELFASGMIVAESWFPIAAAMAVMALGGLHAYFYSLLFAALGLSLWWLARKEYVDLKKTQAYKDLALTSFFITLLFGLTFVGLQYTSPINVAIILFLQVLFSYLFLGRKQGESLNARQLFGGVLMTLGALLVLFPGKIQLSLGDFLVLLASMVAPIANLYQKRARQHVSSATVLLVRSVIALPFIYLLALAFEASPSWQMVYAQIWPLLFVGLVVFFLAKVLWIEAIHRLPITKVNALFAFSPLLTMLWSWWFLEQHPLWFQVAGVVPILMGALLISSLTPSKKANKKA